MAIVEGDVFTEEPECSARLYDSDYIGYKPNCDVLFNGHAYLPYSERVKQVDVSLQNNTITVFYSNSKYQ